MKPLKSRVVISYHTLQKCVKVFRRINGFLATKNNRDSWGMCTTSVECKTVVTTVLTVMSSMDPYTIRVTCVGMVEILGVGQSCLLGRATIVDSVVCSMSRSRRRDVGVE
jgi:hypothetical protein